MRIKVSVAKKKTEKLRIDTDFIRRTPFQAEEKQKPLSLTEKSRSTARSACKGVKS